MKSLPRKLEMPILLLIGLTLGFLIWGADDLRAALSRTSLRKHIVFEIFDPSPFPSLGPEDARVTIVEFGDYECPFCKAWHDEVLPQIRQRYPDQVRLVFVDYPLNNIHPNSFIAAEAAHCAGDQGHYWPYHDALFDRQADLQIEIFTEIAAGLSLDVEPFDTCLQEGKFSNLVRQSIQQAEALGLSGTPAFLVNGQPLMGAQPFEVFAALIEEALSK